MQLDPIQQVFIRDLAVGAWPKTSKIKCHVDVLRPSQFGNSKFYGRLSDPTGTLGFTVWDDDVMPFKEGDDIILENCYKVSEFNGQLEVRFGKYYRVKVVGE